MTPNLASMRAVKMAIKDEAWYRVSQQDLAAAGLDLKGDPQRLQLYVDGVEQPMLVAGDGAVEFFGTGQDSLSTNARVYWLVNGDRTGKRIQVLPRDGTGGGALSFPYTVERRDRSIYFSSLRNGDVENFFGQVVTSSGINQTVALSRLDSTEAQQVEIALQGATSGLGVIIPRPAHGRLGWMTLAGSERQTLRQTRTLMDGDTCHSS